MSRFSLNGEEIEVYWAENYFNEKFIILKNCTKGTSITINSFRSKDRAIKECKRVENILKFIGTKEMAYDNKRAIGTLD